MQHEQPRNWSWVLNKSCHPLVGIKNNLNNVTDSFAVLRWGWLLEIKQPRVYLGVLSRKNLYAGLQKIKLSIWRSTSRCAKYGEANLWVYPDHNYDKTSCDFVRVLKLHSGSVYFIPFFLRPSLQAVMRVEPHWSSNMGSIQAFWEIEPEFPS